LQATYLRLINAFIHHPFVLHRSCGVVIHCRFE
jgi:hypothetical protein